MLRCFAEDGLGTLKEFLERQRWFAAKARGVGAVRVHDWAILEPEGPMLLVLLDVDGERYYLPVGIATRDDHGDAILRIGSPAIVDAHDDPNLGCNLLRIIQAGGALPGTRGRFVAQVVAPWTAPDWARVASIEIRRLSGEQSNTSIAFGRDLILKSFRRPRRGINPEVEMTRFLTERTGFRHSPPLVGWMDYVEADGETAAVAVLQRFVVNSGDGWRHVLLELGRALDSVASRERAGATVLEARPGDALIADIRCLGTVTGDLHAALASDASAPGFAPEPVTAEDCRRWASEIGRAVDRLASIAAAARADEPVTRAL